MSASDDNPLLQSLTEVQQFSDALTEMLEQETRSHSSGVLDFLGQLHVAIEELHVAEEELSLQNEQLIAANQATECAKQRYQELFEFAPDGYLVTDPQGIIQEANQMAARLFGQPQQQLMMAPLAKFIPLKRRPAFRALLNQMPYTHRVQDWETMMGRTGTHLFHAALTVQAVQNASGQLEGLRWLIRDITTRKQAEAQMQQIQSQNRELLEAEQIKNRFIANVSHELRTPLNAIVGFSQVLIRRMEQQPDLASMVERIHRNSYFLLKMVEDLLDVSQLKANRLKLQIATLDLGSFLAQGIEDLKPLAHQKGLRLDLHLPDAPLLIDNDADRLRQIVTNLVSNAIKFTEVGGVTVEVRLPSVDRVAILVRDTGIGIDPVEQSRIFQEFWQIHQSSTQKSAGTGLGLAIVKALVDRMEGKISLDSSLGRGSTFYVELPRHFKNN